jgi:Ca2+-binding EF-hand superfamily protein
MLLPCEDNLLRNITLDRPSRRVGRFDSLPRDIELALLDIIEKEIDLQRRLDILKGDLEVRYDFTSYAAYRSVDKYNDGFINTFNLGSFLRSCGHYATERELLTIVRRIDTDGDARLSYSEFAEFLRSANPPARQVLEEADHAHRSASAEKFRKSLYASTSHSSPLKSGHDHARPHSHGRGAASFASPDRHSSPLRESSPPAHRHTASHSETHPYPRMSPTRKPLLHLHEEDQLVNSLRDIIVLERELESNKVSLALKSDFNLVDAFKIFDRDSRG